MTNSGGESSEFRVDRAIPGADSGNASAARRLTLRPAGRIKESADFQRLYNQGSKAGDQHLLVFAAPNGLSFSRFGLSVSKKHGNAVRRNRRKRLLREAFRLLQQELPPGLDLVLIPSNRIESSLNDYQSSLIRLSRKLMRRFPPASETQRADHV
ncbi:MAG: ribonuclease P protein component [Planctomyces sp.]|jgi:ribonuclease P protein component